jgi:hypothetical protein
MMMQQRHFVRRVNEQEAKPAVTEVYPAGKQSLHNV